ncbi:HlyD family type I secretion periplasmic adaptor subunit [Mesorhizobium sp. 113-1-2]|uniref:HlyD family type I secretion periplasmic adaptor subunit n=1 Tax=Mesorhizobium sp. 113-1-2 TaxID=2744515 RepID=UPI0019364558|nr:HlyD family type I secretion periplasmic adaptor subunit [Mesorhizobium sp. 113-1-2]BCG73346.1 HlyD family type I secretion periplasmic adaptor subunit [Mesorhizobium sp. 113-1-2]
MNARTPPPSAGQPIPPLPSRKPRPRRSDQEFLAPALEILETPPSPVRMALILIICAFVATTLVWAYFGRIDIIASAQGKFEPTGKVKIIQPLETGRVKALPPVEGTHVSQGDVLLELDATEEIADEAGFKRDLVSSQAEATRRRTAIDAAREQKLPSKATIAWGDDVPDLLRSREQNILNGDLGQLASNLDSLKAQRQEKLIERDHLAQTIETQESLISTLQARVTMRAAAQAKDADTKSSVIDATETLKYQVTQLAIQQGQLADAEAAALVQEREIDKALEAFISDNTQRLGDAERQVDDLTQKLAKATAERERKTIVSPISGMVEESVITNVGQVVTMGQEVMRIVPDDSKLELRVYVLNTDIGFVKAGQEAVVKIQSFPFTRYGTITAKVANVATDAIPEPDATQLEGNPAAQISNATFAGAERTQNLVFPVTLTPDKTVMSADGHDVPLTPGMAATVEIKTDSRRILGYVFSPIVEVTSEAFKER